MIKKINIDMISINLINGINFKKWLLINCYENIIILELNKSKWDLRENFLLCENAEEAIWKFPLNFQEKLSGKGIVSWWDSGKTCLNDEIKSPTKKMSIIAH